ncbi:MAG TPA: hypothetical protein ENJ82_14845, partial [Bacteroidetes bacterium]|nr:hypothetical protein [Bacteroidota bacterium]
RIGAINWFGVHTTSIHNDNRSICWDNKGYAADYLERDVQKQTNGKAFLGAFAQGIAGDVTPNHVWDRKKKWMRGPFMDDFANARLNGRLQYEHAAAIYDHAAKGHEVTGDLDWAHVHVNFANVAAAPEFANGKRDARTVPACHGVAFMAGTLEGPGMPKLVALASRFLAFSVKMYEYATSVFQAKWKRKRLRQKYKAQGKKVILIESGERRVLGTSDIKGLVVPGCIDPTIRNFKRLHPKGWDEDKPWTPHVLPLQIILLGDIALVGLPAEITTIAGKRLRNVIEDILLPTGIHRVLIAPYSNAYCGYITTNEEYQVQAYEGGHTVFGQWTLAAFQTKLKQLALEILKKAASRQVLDEVQPPEFTAEELGRRSFQS